MSDNSRLTKNTILLYVRMLLVMAISLYTSRIVLQNLGIDNYGLYEVVGSIATMFIFLNTAMNSSTQRYLTIAIGKDDEKLLHKIFNVSCVIHGLIGLFIVFLCEILGLWFINYKMAIPEGREIAVIWAFEFSLLAAFVTIISVPYNALLIARERMGAFAYISILDVIFKLLIAYIITVVTFDRLIFYSLLLAISQIFLRCVYSLYCNRNFSECSLKWYPFDSLYKEMSVFAFWGLLGHVAFIINTSIQNMMLNVFFSPVINAARGVAMRVSGAISGFSDNFQTAVSPQITKAWAKGDRDRTYNLIFNSTRFSLYLLWILSLPILINVDNILGLWLIKVPNHASNFLVIIIIYNLLGSGANPLNMAIRANGRIRNPELYSGLALILNLPVSYILLINNFGPESVFIVMIACNFLCLAVKLLFARMYLQLPIAMYIKKVVLRPSVVILVSALIPFLMACNFYFYSTIINIMVISIICEMSILLTIYALGLNKEERNYILMSIKKRIK